MSAQLFLSVLSKSFGESLTRAAWNISKPLSFQQPDDITNGVGSIIKHPLAEQYAWSFTDDPLLVHTEADPHGLDTLFDALIAAGVCLPAEKQETQHRIAVARGTPKTIIEIIPDGLIPSVRYFEQMQQEGWFPNV